MELCLRCACTQVCGSCWAEAATGALSDRYKIATKGKLNLNLAPQNLLNFDPKLSGGGCQGGDSAKAYSFIRHFGITDDTCATFLGEDFGSNYGFDGPDVSLIGWVQGRMCHYCEWNGDCDWCAFAAHACACMRACCDHARTASARAACVACVCVRM